MKFYYAAGACSLSVRMALHEAGLDFDAITVDLHTHKTADGQDFYQLNPKGYVPLLVLDNGDSLCEAPAVLQWIADQAKAKQLMPAEGTISRYHAVEWLNFIATELHKNFSPLFNPTLSDETKAVFKQQIQRRLAWVDGQLANKAYLLGDNLCVADLYLFVVCCWTGMLHMDIAANTHLLAFMERMKARPQVQAALKEEGF